MSITTALPRNVAVKEIEGRSAAGSALEADVLPALTDGFHLVIDALKLNGIATIAPSSWLPGGLRDAVEPGRRAG